MYVIDAKNVNDALGQGLNLISRSGENIPSRNGMTLEVPFPVSTVYRNPWQRVLISKARDANPFFHLMEAMWILAGREDVQFLTEFNKRMGDYSDDKQVFNAPYGQRLRDNFPIVEGGNATVDQLQSVINILTHDPMSRQAVCQIWDTTDLHKNTKDKACNMSLVFRVRNGKLCLTVYNRSNDMVWGAYGANVVQFSMIQEYIAAHLNLAMGTYTQVSNSYHVYTEGPGGEVLTRLVQGYRYYDDPYADIPFSGLQLMHHDDMEAFEYDLSLFFNIYDEFGIRELGEMMAWKSKYFHELVIPMLCVYLTHKQYGPTEGLKYVHRIGSDDWRLAATDWLEIRATKIAKESQDEHS